MKKVFTILLIVFVFTLVYTVKPASASDCGCNCDCNCDCEGVGTPGYWKNHPEAWPVDTIEIWFEHEVVATYTKAEALYWLDQSVKGDKSITMFKAVVAATLNNLAGCGCEKYWIWEGHWWVMQFPPGSGVEARSEAWQYSHGETIYYWLDQYNNGLLCAPPRD